MSTMFWSLEGWTLFFPLFKMLCWTCQISSLDGNPCLRRQDTSKSYLSHGLKKAVSKSPCNCIARSGQNTPISSWYTMVLRLIFFPSRHKKQRIVLFIYQQCAEHREAYCLRDWKWSPNKTNNSSLALKQHKHGPDVYCFVPPGAVVMAMHLWKD